jgi:hypothetical protein
MEPPVGNQILEIEGILKITIPPQSQPGEFRLVRKDLPGKAMMRPLGNFYPGRMLANFMIVDASREGAPVVEFDPPLEMEVIYHIEDLYQAAKVNRKLKLAYFDDRQWYILNDFAERFEILPPGLQGRNVCALQISYWPADPPMCWGT